MSINEDNEFRRISIDLPKQLVDRFDTLKREWGLRGRGAVLERLLEELLLEDPAIENTVNENNDSSIQEDITSISNRKRINENNKPESNYNENTALVLISNSFVESQAKDNDNNLNQFDNHKKLSGLNSIDLPGFVSRKTKNLKKSLSNNTANNYKSDNYIPTVSVSETQKGLLAAKNHWISLYGQPPNETVIEAAMAWLARDIWINIEGVEGQPFTWTAANRRLKEHCHSWDIQVPNFERIIFIAGILEDPFSSDTLPERVPTLIRRFVNRFKKSRNVTSFQTLESTMTVHGALKILELPTQAGATLTLNRIREAYRSKAISEHPDSGGSTDAMRKLNEAYQLLKELYRKKDLN